MMDSLRVHREEPDRFRRSFHVPANVFSYLVENLGDELATKRGIPPQLRVLIALFTLIGPHALQRTSDLFGIGVSTVHLIQNQVFSAIYKKLLRQHVRWPIGAERE